MFWKTKDRRKKRLFQRKSGGSDQSRLLCDVEGNGAGRAPFLSNRLWVGGGR